MESSPSDRETGREEINKDENNEDSIAGANPVLIPKFRCYNYEERNGTKLEMK